MAQVAAVSAARSFALATPGLRPLDASWVGHLGPACSRWPAFRHRRAAHTCGRILRMQVSDQVWQGSAAW